MRTNLESIYACGDVCSVDWAHQTPNWFQMKLWTQARQLGFYTAKCVHAHLTNSNPELYFNFEVFSHVTKFFGFRVILLGCYNGQNLLENNYKILCKVEPKKCFIKVILQAGRMRGAILIGETDFEETFESLIYNQIDLTRFGDDLLENVVDLEDYFD